VSVTFFPLSLSVSRLVLHLGGPGLVALGLIDNSFIPTPAAQDFVTALLAASDPDWWLYYALMATVGAILGGFVIFRLGRKGGEAAMEGHISRQKVETVTRRFRKWGWGAIFFPTILPPPFPAAPFLFAAGALKYPLKKYLALVVAGRLLRYLVVAYLASTFGAPVFRQLRESGALLLVTLIVLVAVGLVFTFWHLRKSRSKRSKRQATRARI
jgi:membrane protein YqaA with SNARE-associated domain